MRCYTLIYMCVGYSLITFIIAYNGKKQKLAVAYDASFILFQIIQHNFSKFSRDVYAKYDVIANFDFKPNAPTHMAFPFAKQFNFLIGIIW